jgi:plasmid stability protein
MFACVRLIVREAEMTDLTIHIPDDTYDALTAHAARRGRSVEAAVSELIHEAASKERLMQGIDRVSRATESVDALVGARSDGPATPPRSRRRYRSVHPTPTGHGR